MTVRCMEIGEEKMSQTKPYYLAIKQEIQSLMAQIDRRLGKHPLTKT